MRQRRAGRRGFLWTAAAAVGCGPQVLPKGKGASGGLSNVDEKADADVALINKLTPDQQKGFDYIHQPFDKATIPVDGLDDAAKAKLEKIRQAWAETIFAKLDEGNAGARIGYIVGVDTNLGPLGFQFITDHCPNITRSFVVNSILGNLNGAKFERKGDLAIFGTPAGMPLYRLAVEMHPRLPPALVPGSLVAEIDADNKVDGTRFALVLKETPLPPNAKIAIFGVNISQDGIGTLTKAEAEFAKKDGVFAIKEMTTTKKNDVVWTQRGVNLPTIGPDGKAIVTEGPPG
ncbi:MAG: hypothetical protein ACRDD1_04765 [Planctomycetia bacterium]